MSKKKASIILIIIDIFCIWGLWSGNHEFQRILTDIHNHNEVIHYGNRISFFIVGLIVPIIHGLTIIEHFRPALIHKNSLLISWGVALLLVGSIAGGIFGSFYLTSRFESAGYIYCRKASGISALAKSVVYTIHTDACEEAAAAHRRRF